MNLQEILRAKATEICERCTSAGLPQPLYRISGEHSVNLTWWREGKNHTLSLYYKPKTQSWTPVPNTVWLKNAVMPVLQPLFGQQPRSVTLSSSKGLSVPLQGRSSSLKPYFVDALDCLSLLAPFANDNIDFSIICKRTREAVSAILHDQTVSSHLNRAALEATLTIPDTTDFSHAKEYLTQCLTLCHISNAVI